MSSKGVVRGLLLRPFERFAGGPALAAGLAILALTAWLGWRLGVHADGVLDLHFGPDGPFWLFLAQGMTNWLVLTALLLAVGAWLGRGRSRLIDLAGTLAVARWPLVPAIAYMGIPGIRQRTEELTARVLEAMPTGSTQVTAELNVAGEAVMLTLLALPPLLAIAWMAWLSFHAYALVFNLNSHRAAWSFIGALILAEIVSKAIAGLLIRSVAGGKVIGF